MCYADTQMSTAMTRSNSVAAWALFVMGAGAFAFGAASLGAVSFGAAKSAGAAAEVRLPAKTDPAQRTALDLEVAFGKGSRGTAVVVRHQPSGEVIGTVTSYGLGMSDGVGRFALTVPQDLEARLRRENQPLRLELEAHTAGSDAGVVLRSVAPKLVPSAR